MTFATSPYHDSTMPPRHDGDREENHDADEGYDENADDDFNPDGADGDEGVSSSSFEEDDDPVNVKRSKARTTPKKRQATRVTEELDSGDEATIKERKRKKRKTADKKNSNAADDDDEDDASGHEGGGFVRTRAQRQAEKVERKQQRRVAGGIVTIDVDQIWLDLQNLPLGRTISPPPMPQPLDDSANGEANKENEKESTPKSRMIKIIRRVEFAGEITEVEEEVLRHSKEAQQYLREHPETDSNISTDTAAQENPTNGLQRPLKRISLFEPNPAGLVKGVAPERLRQRAPSRQDVVLLEQRAEELRKKKAEKMTTVQKSALDWRSYVDQQGLREELDEYGKSRSTFLGREDFLDRAQGARDERAREARLKA